MSDKNSEANAGHWKQQYYDQLDLLDSKEKDWQEIESILKKTVLRLSIAAEGQHATIDRHLQDIRSVVKKQVNAIRLESILEDISGILLKIGDKQQAADRKVVSMFAHLLESINLPDTVNKQKDKLIKKLSKSTDKDSDELAVEVQALLSSSVHQVSEANVAAPKTGLLSNLFKSQDTSSKTNNGDKSAGSQTVAAENYDSVVSSIVQFVNVLPWPDSLKKEVKKLSRKLSKNKIQDIDESLQRLFLLVNQWQQLDGAEKVVRSDVRVEAEVASTGMSDSSHAGTAHHGTDSYTSADDEKEPSAQEILIRLLQQLVVPPDLHDVVEDLKKRIQTESSTSNWKMLLKDVAQLINTLRSRMQEEKHEFESFLQQITGRLQEMDGFLLQEDTALKEAKQAGGAFDAVVNAQVQDIHDDLSTVDNLGELKNMVEKRLSVVSDHIKQYRVNEQVRYTNAQQNVEKMQSRLISLEQESGDLRQLILEKNKEAMFDVLTEIPNRLAYEKKAVEEIARCKRFATPLCMAVWDVDLFKQVNDNYGHKVGDKVLKAIAQLLSARMRETDFIARYGGEEFVMFLPGADEDKALILVDTLREKIAACSFKHHGGIVRATVSCGVTSFRKGDSHEMMFERADKALYAAKNGGRNKCLLSEEG